MGAPSESPESLLAHAGWLRRLAHHLVRDPERAEDLVQDTWVAALGRPPREAATPGAARAFLEGVLRNLLRHRARSDGHRRARELAHARSEATAPSSDLVDEVDSQRMLIEEVLRLPEPGRTTVLLRYFRDRSAAEIAREEDVPAATVRARLKRALDDLRARLDARHGGDRSSWTLGVLAWAREAPLPAPAAPSPTPAQPLPIGLAAAEGVLVMKTVKLALLAGVTALAAYGVARVSRSPEPASAAPEQTLTPSLADTGPGPAAESASTVPLETRAPARRAATEVAEDAHDTEEVEPLPGATPLAASLLVHFADADGIAVPQVELRLERLFGTRNKSYTDAAVSGPRGDATLELRNGSGGGLALLSWRAEGYLLGGLEVRLDDEGPTDLGTITLVRGTPVSGRVVDPAGRPIADARVWAGSARFPEGDRGQIERKGPRTVGERSSENDTTPTVRSLPDGTFRIPGAAIGGARVWAHAEGMRYGCSEPIEVVAEHETPGVEVVLEPLSPDDLIEGMVLSPDGETVPGAEVRYSIHDDGFGLSSAVYSDDEGSFRLVVWRRVPHTFTARAPDGGITAHVARVEPGTHDLVLRLGERETLELVVTDPEDQALDSYEVNVCVGTETNWTGHFLPGSSHPEGRMSVDTPGTRFWLEVHAPGHELGKAGPYEPGDVPELVELVLRPTPGLSGRVLVDGTPREGVLVELHEATNDTQVVEVNGLPAAWTSIGEEARTDEDGRYLLTPRRAGEYLVRAEVEGRAPGESQPVHFEPGVGAAGVDVNVGSGGTLEVRAVAPGGADATGAVIAVSRGDGHPLTSRVDAHGLAVFEHLIPGRWNVLAVDEEFHRRGTRFRNRRSNEPRAELPWVVEVLEGGTSRYTLALEAGE